MTDDYVKTLERLRREKDEAFRSDPHSPVPHAARATMKALRYFLPDPAWRFRARLVKHPHPEVVTMGTSDGDAREYLNLGHFALDVAGERVDVQAYWHESSPGLFVPFRDATSGKESYGAGRYLDLEWHGADAEYDVDFNLAYNPYCAYSEDFSCPLPPVPNWLKVAIRAGEKTFDASATTASSISAP